MPKETTKKKKVTPKYLVKLTIRGAADHDDVTEQAIQTWVAGVMMDYHRDRADYDSVHTVRYTEG